MQTAVAAESPPKVLATFDLTDPNERQILGIIQRFYDPDGRDRLRAIRRGVAQTAEVPRRLAVTLGSFRPLRRNAKTEWSVILWHIDEIEGRIYSCKSRQEALELFATL